jgi:uncharacterized damage-inducible protein DinB
MDRSYLDRNRLSRQRLHQVIDSLSDDSFGQIVHGGWTVVAILAHLGAEDRRIQGWLEDWERQGIRESAALREWEQWAIRTYGENDNDQRLPQWLAADPQSTIREAIAAAESIDAKIETLSPELADALLSTTPFWGSRRQWALDRSIHRHEHLDAIETVLALLDTFRSERGVVIEP